MNMILKRLTKYELEFMFTSCLEASDCGERRVEIARLVIDTWRDGNSITFSLEKGRCWGLQCSPVNGYRRFNGRETNDRHLF